MQSGGCPIERSSTVSRASKTILVSANQAWNLLNFRRALLLALQKDGFALAAAAPANAEFGRRLEAIGIAFHPVEIDSKGLSPKRDAQLFMEYRRLMGRLRPVAYLGWTIKPNIYGALAAKSLGIPSFLNVSGLGTAFVRQNALTEVVSLLYRVGFRGASAVFLQNASDEAEFLRRGLVRPGQVHRLNGSGIDIEHFAPTTRDRTSRGRFLMIARLLGDKGVREFEAAARQLKAEDASRRFAILGFADVENRTAIPSAELSVWRKEGIVELLDPRDDVRPAIEAADCVVLPSYREGTSRVLLEGAAMARPLVATDVPGCREVVVDGETGFLCRAGDVQTLATAMRRIEALHDDDWRRMGDNGRAKVAADFSEAAVIATYFEALARANVTP